MPEEAILPETAQAGDAVAVCEQSEDTQVVAEATPLDLLDARITDAFDQFVDVYLNLKVDWLLINRLYRLKDDVVRRAAEFQIPG